jgi:hypothetical protein
MNIIEAASQLRQGTAWNLRGDILEQADNGAPRVTPPTSDEINAFIEETAYRDQRKKDYPPIGDQLDALWKGGDAAAAMLDQIHAIKAKYPKP